MNAAEFVEYVGKRHDPDEPAVLAGGICWHRVHVLKTEFGITRYEYWRYMGADDTGELYQATVDMHRMVLEDLTSLEVSFDGALGKRLVSAMGEPVRTIDAIYVWMPADPPMTLQLPGGLEFTARWVGAHRVVEKYVDGELVETCDRFNSSPV